MAIVQAPQYWKTNIIIMGLIAVLTACGGGGGSNDDDTPPPVSDTTPDSFTFTAVTNADVNAVVESNSITVDGINAAATISITGGEYKVASGDYSTSNSTVTDGQSITVRLTTPEAGNQIREATLLIGGVSATFTVTTRPDDTTPDAFSFAAVTDAAVASEVTSEAITISGINAAAAISIADGEYSVDGGEFTTDEGTVVEGQSITVRATSSNDLNTRHTVVLTIGGVVGQFEITTLADTTAPVAEFMFPPPVSMTEGDTLRVRGKITDDFSSVENAIISVNGIEQSLTITPNEDGTVSWDVTLELAEGENTLVVSAIDSEGNDSFDGEGMAQVNVRRDSALNSYPDSASPLSAPRAMVYDQNNDQLLVTGYEENRPTISSIDIQSGQRELFVELDEITPLPIQDILLYEDNNQLFIMDDTTSIITLDLASLEIEQHTWDYFSAAYTFLLDDVEDKKLVVPNVNHDVITVQLDFSTPAVFSDGDNSELGVGLKNIRGIALDRTYERYLLSSPADQVIYEVNRTSGMRNIFSGMGVGSGDEFSPVATGYLREIVVDEKRQRAMVVEEFTGNIFAIRLSDASRSIMSSSEIDENNPMGRVYGMAIKDLDSYIFVCDPDTASIFAVDIETGHRVYFSKN